MTNERQLKRHIFGVAYAFVWEEESFPLFCCCLSHARLCSMGDLTAFRRVIWGDPILAEVDAGEIRRR